VRARITYVNLIARPKAILGRKLHKKTYQEIKIRFCGPAASFLAGETVTFCLNAPAGPIRSFTAEMPRGRVVPRPFGMWTRLAGRG
jgi:hypothetical protein